MKDAGPDVSQLIAAMANWQDAKLAAKRADELAAIAHRASEAAKRAADAAERTASATRSALDAAQRAAELAGATAEDARSMLAAAERDASRANADAAAGHDAEIAAGQTLDSEIRARDGRRDPVG